MDPQSPRYGGWKSHFGDHFVTPEASIMQRGNPSNMRSNLCILKHSFSNFIFLSARPISERCLGSPKPGCRRRENAGGRITPLVSSLGDCHPCTQISTIIINIPGQWRMQMAPWTWCSGSMASLGRREHPGRGDSTRQLPLFLDSWTQF